MKAIAESCPIVCLRLRAFIGQMREAFLVFFRSWLQAVRLAFGGIFGGSLRLGLGLSLRVRFRRVGRAAGDQKGDQDDD